MDKTTMKFLKEQMEKRKIMLDVEAKPEDAILRQQKAIKWIAQSEGMQMIKHYWELQMLAALEELRTLKLNWTTDIENARLLGEAQAKMKIADSFINFLVTNWN